MLSIALIFFIIALLYSMVGFGGGSSYIAILAAFDVPYQSIPKISLLCNIIVVAGGCWHYYRAGLIDKKLATPFLISSVPLSFIGGSFRLTEGWFFGLLAFSLLLSGLRIFFIRAKEASEISRPSFAISLLIGGAIGLFSGMIGIGGGIFLSPILIMLGHARSKNAAAIASLFILLNSIAGMLGQLNKGSALESAQDYMPIFLAVIVGGQLGSRVGSHPKMPYKAIQIGTGLLVLLVGGRILFIHF